MGGDIYPSDILRPWPEDRKSMPVRKRLPGVPDPENLLNELLAVIDGSKQRKRERAREGFAAARERRKRAARERAEQRLEAAQRREKEERRLRLESRGMPVHVLALNVMEPGKWYGTGDVERLAGIGRGVKVKLLQKLWPDRLVTRRLNPNYTGEVINPYRIHAGEIVEPKWLYSITPAGEAERERWRAMIQSADRG